MEGKWNSELKNSIHEVNQLKKYTCLSKKVEKKLNEILKRHPMSIPPYYMDLIDWDNPNDPIKKMAIPSLNELNLEGSYDTSGEKENTKLPGLQHKYKQTALILSTNKCAHYCRYCFRKRMVGLSNGEVIKRFKDVVDYIKVHKEINNILISGGDPLVLPNDSIESFLLMLSEIKHLKFIRFGTKTPVTLPSRFEDKELLNIFRKYSTPDRRIYFITQFNYPREISEESKIAINRLISAGVILSNQTVLMKGINDYPRTMAKLQNNLARIGVTPYYVFQCRPVKRVKSAFQIPLSRGIEILETAKKSCNGLSKRFKFIMSHRTGKIEIIGIRHNEIYFKYHQAKYVENLGKIFKRKLDLTSCWLDDFKKHQN